MRKFFPLLGVVAALLLVPTTAPAAEIGLNVAGGAAASQADVDAVADTGAKWARHFLFWNDLDENGMQDFRKRVLEAEKAKGIKTLIVVAHTQGQPPDPNAFADFMGKMATAFKGEAEAYEVWNEADESLWWKPQPDVRAYVNLLRTTYPKVKAADPGAMVLFTPLTGANYQFLEQAYAAGAQGSFDAVGVHTDTACLIDSPYSYYRDPAAGNRIARFTFLGVREVKAVMQAKGDNKPVWITEMGWPARAGQTCDTGMFAGKKAAGVTEEEQSQFMLEAFHCLNVDPLFGVDVAMWFTHKDVYYGLMRQDGSQRPAYGAFKGMAGDTSHDRLTGPCGDFVPPEIQILEPKPGLIIGDRDPLKIRATSTDKEVLRMTFTIADAKEEIRNFTNNGNPLDFSKETPGIDWQGVRQLPFGKHTLVVTALDRSGNEGRAQVEFTRVNPSTLPPKKVTFKSLKVSGSGLKRKLRGKIVLGYPFALSAKDKVSAEWQNKRKGKWKKIHGGLKAANKPQGFTFNQKLRYKGQWRVRVVFLGKAPYKTTKSPWLKFKVK